MLPPSPLDDSQPQQCLERLKSSLMNLYVNADVREPVREVISAIVRVSLRLFPRDGSIERQRLFLEDGSIESLLTVVMADVSGLLVWATKRLDASARAVGEAHAVRTKHLRGYRAVLGEWKHLLRGIRSPNGHLTDAMRDLAELYDLSVLHPTHEYRNADQENPIQEMEELLRSISLALNEVARRSRATDASIRTVFNLMHQSTSIQERRLIVSSSPSSSDGRSDTTMPSPIGSSQRAMSFSADVKIPDAIEELRCAKYGQANHECETADCTIGASDSPLSRVESMSGLDDLHPKPSILMMPRSMSFGSRTAQKRERQLQRLPLRSSWVFGSAPHRHRTISNETQETLLPAPSLSSNHSKADSDKNKHTPSKSTPVPPTQEKPVSRPRENTL